MSICYLWEYDTESKYQWGGYRMYTGRNNSLASLITERPRLSNKPMPCEVGMDLAALGRRWTFHILRNIELHVDRFNKILRLLPGLTPRVLIMRLNELEARGLIRPVAIQERPRQVRWELTDKGIDTLPIVQGYLSYANKWYPNASLKNHKREPAKSTGLMEMLEDYEKSQTSRI